MTGIPRPEHYTELEFDALSQRLRDTTAVVLPDLSTDGEAEPARILLDQSAHVGDVLSYYLRMMVRESRLATSVQRRNVIAHAKAFGYRPLGRTAATTTLEFYLDAPAASAVAIPAGSVAQTVSLNPTVSFRTTEAATIAVGQTVAKTEDNELPHGVHSTAMVDTFQSTGAPDQSYTTSQRDVIDDGSVVVVASNGTYTQATNNSMLSSRSNDLHYVTAIDHQGRCTFRFGDGVAGAIPVGSVEITYAYGGGATGTGVAIGAARTVTTGFVNELGQTVAVKVRNTTVSAGGYDAESNASIRANVPLTQRVLTRAVQPQDFEYAARTHSTTRASVSRALCLTKLDDATILNDLEHVLWLVTHDGSAATETLREKVLALFTRVAGYPTPPYPANTLVPVTVRTAIYEDISVRAVVYVRAGRTKATVKADILARLASFFGPSIASDRLREIAPVVAAEAGVKATDGSSPIPNPLVDFGARMTDNAVALSDIYNLIHDTTGVLKLGGTAADVTMKGVHADAAVSVRAFPRLGTVTLIDGETGGAL